MGGPGEGRIGRARDGETQGSGTRGRGGLSGSLGPLDRKGDGAGQVWNKQGRERTGSEEGRLGGEVRLKRRIVYLGEGRPEQVWRPLLRR